MGTILLWMLKGALYGGIGAIGLFAVGFGLEIINCGCGILACDCDRSMIFDWSGIFGILTVFVICGAAIGLFYGFFKAKEASDEETNRRNYENSEKARKQRIVWADTIKQKALNVDNTCSHNKTIDQSIVFTEYKADTQMKEIVNELSKVAELEGLVNSLIEELS